ncbi:general substrate transporter [Rhizodiscina lignyota]|uniref:General substrate transporter n=1 Tax=Rhizodiscina lignyota TaxID=1504668 RepID=A0A9P4M6S0_9PEZI|nr:general substrate transporter [Rhizodiscina lignyota]
MAPNVLKSNPPEQVQVAQEEAPKLRHVTWYKDPGLRKLYACCIVVCMSSATTGYDGSMLNGLQILPVWQDYFQHPHGSLLGLFGSIYSIGNLAGLPFAPYIADRYGRKLAIAIGCCILFVGCAVQGASHNFKMFIAARFFVGLGCSISQGAAPLLITEICHPQHRGRVTAAYNTLWYFGAIIATWTTFGTFKINNNWCWRIPSILQAAPSLFQIIFLYFVPESPRWLLSKDRDQDALNMLAKYHASGDMNDATVQFEFHEIRETLHLEKRHKKQSSYLDFLRTKGNRRRLLTLLSLGLFSQWSGNGLTGYYFAIVMDGIGITDKDTQFILSGCLNIKSLIVALLVATLVDRVGRRPLFITATAGMFVIFVLWTACSGLYDTEGNKAAGKAVVAFVFLFGVMYNFAWNGLMMAYAVEILPYKIRAKGIMLLNLFVQAALVFNQYINPIGLASLLPHWRFYAIYCGWLVFELIFVYFFYLETRGPTLEEIAKIFDGDEAEVAHIDQDMVDEKIGAVHVEELPADEAQVHVKQA